MDTEIKSIYSYIIFDFGEVKLKVDNTNNAYLIDKRKPESLISVDYTTLKEYLHSSQESRFEVKSMGSTIYKQ